MDFAGLSVPNRPDKPRTLGQTWIIDDGVPLGYFRDVIQSAYPWIDGVKFGWGTGLVTPRLAEKIDILRDFAIDFTFGGTLFEWFYAQGRFTDFVEWCQRWEARTVEVSSGVLDLPQLEKTRIIRELSSRFRVFSEVGPKDVHAADSWTHQDWIDRIETDLNAGAAMVVLETREFGMGGLCDSDGHIRVTVVDEILMTSLPTSRFLWEAPTKSHQTYWIKRLGPNVNLANIPMTQPIAVETLRRGLRADTMHMVTAVLGVDYDA
ncbi:MAG: phosphosulfolactate synthase [Sulfobacillus sp.]|nr:phosphosulfolactate synthase [Sulfobacillus sp.]